jgi:Skp family chaperone for outer membrane proteins
MSKTMSTSLKTTSALVAWALLATGTEAAVPAAAPAAIFAGPSIPGVCLLGQEAVFANTKVGLAATARLQQLAQGAGAQIAPERTALEADAKALQAEAAKLKPAELQQRQQALAQRAQAYQAKAAELQQRVEATRAKALQQVSQDEQPVVADVYKAHGCGVLFARSGVLAGGQGMDITPAVVQSLDAKITTITFDLEPAPAPGAVR